MNKAWMAIILPGLFIVIVSVLILALLILKLLWPWTIPDLFPGAVEQGLIAREISWYTSFKLAIFVAVIAGMSGIFHGKESSC
jgi:hypothetical protein